jgi:hypothetical protein
MAVSKIISDDYCEIDFKVHYDYYGSERCTLMSVSLRELLSLGFIGLEGLIQTQIKYLGRMPAVRIMYKDDENDYIDLLDTNFNRFIRQVRTFQARCDFPVVNLKVVEGSSPAGIKSAKLDGGSSCTRLEQNCEPVAIGESLIFKPTMSQIFWIIMNTNLPLIIHFSALKRRFQTWKLKPNQRRTDSPNLLTNIVPLFRAGESNAQIWTIIFGNAG